MISINDQALYKASLQVLATHTQRNYYGRLAQIFLACKFYGNLIPRVGDPIGTDVATLQRLLDELYDKPSLKPGPSISITFNANHLYPGVKSNIWRNNFNFQKGFGCYAPAAEILNLGFRNASRKACPHLAPRTIGTLRGAKCRLELKAEYRSEDHPKVFRIDPLTREHFVYDPADTNHYAALVVASSGRIPIAPLIVALYYDSRISGGRQQVDITDFLLDFGFSPAEFTVYFDDDPAQASHQTLARAYPGKLSWTRISAVTVSPPSAPLPGIPVSRVPASRRHRPSITTTVAPTAPPAGSFWWDAEQAVRQALVADSWTVVDHSRFGMGYDLFAHKSGTNRHVEVKSSAGRCAPLLTDNEYAEAVRLRQQYVLAIVENFDPVKPVNILWVQDPARLQMTARQMKAFSLPRSAWLPSASGRIT